MSGGLRSGEVAAAAGVNQQTLRYYERRGLLADPVRSAGGHRLYPPEAVTVLRVIKVAQRLGFTLQEAGELLDIGRRGHGHRGARGRGRGLHAQATGKLAEVEQRIADLQVIAETLRAAIAAGCDDLAACADDACCPVPFQGLPSAAVANACAAEGLPGDRDTRASWATRSTLSGSADTTDSR